MRRVLLFCCIWLVTATALANQNLLFIVDGSGSMWGRIQGEPKIVVAREVMSDVIADLPSDSQVGLVAYGHNRKGDCEDIETLVPLGPLQRDQLSEQVQGINPKGKTPITGAVEHAVEQLRILEDSSAVVLVSDGLESCGGDPCEAVRLAREAGVRFRMHVVGFDLGDADADQLQCMAEASGGRYFTANNADELSAALTQAVAPPAGLDVMVTANGEPLAARTYVHHESSDEEADRESTSDDGLARYQLEPGRYRLTVRPDGIDAPDRVFDDIEVLEGETVEKQVDFSSGSITLTVTANGEPLKARTYVHHSDSGKEASRDGTDSQGRAHYEIPVGSYSITVRPDGISAPNRVLEDIVVEAGEQREESVDFSFGRVELTVTTNGAPLSARTYIVAADSGKEADRSSTDSDGQASYEIPPGNYRIRVRPQGIAAPDQFVEDIVLDAGETVTRSLEIPSGSLEVQVSAGGEPIKARTYLVSADSGKEIDRESTNREGLALYRVPVGDYLLRVRPPRNLDAGNRTVEDIRVSSDQPSRVTVDFDETD